MIHLGLDQKRRMHAINDPSTNIHPALLTAVDTCGTHWVPVVFKFSVQEISYVFWFLFLQVDLVMNLFRKGETNLRCGLIEYQNTLCCQEVLCLNIFSHVMTMKRWRIVTCIEVSLKYNPPPTPPPPTPPPTPTLSAQTSVPLQFACLNSPCPYVNLHVPQWFCYSTSASCPTLSAQTSVSLQFAYWH